MSVTVYNMNVICEASGHQVTPLAPNVCITPAAPSPLPMPYPVTGDSSCLDPGTQKVTIAGKKAMNKKSCVKKVHGNEAGTQKDIVTHVTSGKATLVQGAPTVLFEGQPIGFTGCPGFANTVSATGPAQTPCLYLDKGGSVFFDADCLKALAACGFPEIAFGSFNQVQKVQKAARDSLDKAGWEPSNATEREVDGLPPAVREFLARAEAGHIATNSLFKQPGGRDNPCDNILPGCEGYNDGMAPCTAHQGSHDDPSTPHGWITKTEGGVAKEQLKNPETSENGTLNQQGLENCVEATATIAVQGVDPQTAANPAMAARMKALQERSAAALMAGPQGQGISTQGGVGADGAGATGCNDDPTKPRAGEDGLAAAQDKAKQCMKAYWRKASEKARKDFASRYRGLSAKELQSMSKPPRPSPAAAKANAAQIAENEARSKELTGSSDPEDKAERNRLRDLNKALRDQCKQAQADYLNWFYDNGKEPPPFTGMTPPRVGGAVV